MSMFFLIAAIVVFIAGLIGMLIVDKKYSKFVPVIGSVLALLLLLPAVLYTQDVGEAKVIRSADGTVVRQDTEAGMGFKAPWQKAVNFDIRGQQAVYRGDGQQDGDSGPEITINAENVATEVDVAVRYSIEAGAVTDIYTTYKTQENLFDKVISQDIKSMVREAANGYSVNDIQNKREEYATRIQDSLTERWADQGIIVESVALQGIRPPQSVVDRFNETQAAQTQVTKEEANTKVIEEQARQAVKKAEGIAEANRIVNDSLTDKVLQQKYIDALSNAKGLVVTPEGSTPMIQVPNQ